MKNQSIALPMLASTLSATLAFTAGCATTREEKFETATTATSESDTSRAQALAAEADALWAERADIEKLKMALSKWEEAFQSEPSADLAVKLARGHYFLADGHYAMLAGQEDNRDAHYNKGTEWGERGIGLAAPDFVAAKQSGAKVAEALKKASGDAVPAFYWWATNLGKWAAGEGLLTVLKYKDDVKATIDFVASTNETFFYGAPHRYLGAYNAKAPGGSLEASEQHFQKAVGMAPEYLGTKVLWADYLCTKKRDRATYKRLLEEVIAADAGADPSIAPENAVEQEKAKKLLADIDDLFGSES